MDKLVEQFEQLKVTAASKDVNSDPGIKELIETYSKAVLDCTFFHENFLTENNFRLESADYDIATSINLLDAIVSLCATVDDCSRRDETLTNFHSLSSASSHLLNIRPNYGDSYRSVINVLGIDFAECLLWRKGSILYAFCSSKLSSDTAWVQENQNNLLNKLRDGINYFHTMLSLRRNLISPSPVDDMVGFSTNDMDLNSSHSHSNRSDNIVFASAKDFNLSKNNMETLLIQKKQIVGALGEELDHMQKSLDDQQIFHEAVQEKIEEELHKNPESRYMLEQKLAELNAKQDEVREQQEKNVEKKNQIDNCLRELSQQIEQQQSESKGSGAPFDSRISSNNQIQSYELIDMGIMSDTYMLAMMYCGDMSFWYCKYSHDWRLLNSSTQELFNDIKHIGVSYLKIYIKAVDRVLQYNGWTNERAKELLRYFADYR